MDNVIAMAFLLPLLAGLFTGIGGLIALFTKRTDKNFLAICISFSAGVMIYISFVEIFFHSKESLSVVYGHDMSVMLTTAAFFGGIIFVALIDRFIPHEDEALDKLTAASDGELDSKDTRALKRMGVMTAIAIAIHNFPEGLVTFIATLHDPSVGLAIAVAIAIHNIPEGIAVAAPIHYATGSKKKALIWSFASGLAEPLGALVAFAFVRQIANETVVGLIFAGVGGIMIYISFHQLLPTAIKFGEHHKVMNGLFAGMAVMALSLFVL